MRRIFFSLPHTRRPNRFAYISLGSHYMTDCATIVCLCCDVAFYLRNRQWYIPSRHTSLMLIAHASANNFAEQFSEPNAARLEARENIALISVHDSLYVFAGMLCVCNKAYQTIKTPVKHFVTLKKSSLHGESSCNVDFKWCPFAAFLCFGFSAFLHHSFHFSCAMLYCIRYYIIIFTLSAFHLGTWNCHIYERARYDDYDEEWWLWCGCGVSLCKKPLVLLQLEFVRSGELFMTQNRRSKFVREISL